MKEKRVGEDINENCPSHGNEEESHKSLPLDNSVKVNQFLISANIFS